jgi:hypothetical protein
VREAAGDISVKASACAVNIRLPEKSNFVVSSSINLGSFKNEYDDEVDRSGNEHSITLEGNAAAIKLESD